ncbi:uncharacterized protein M6G45_015271 [Spheniscus humboldti]
MPASSLPLQQAPAPGVYSAFGTSSLRSCFGGDSSQPRQQMNEAERRREGDDSSVYARCSFLSEEETADNQGRSPRPDRRHSGDLSPLPACPRHPLCGQPRCSFHAPTSTRRLRLPALPSHSQDRASNNS